MRFRDIKRHEDLMKLHGYDLASPDAVKLHADIKRTRDLRKAQEKYQREIGNLPPLEKRPSPPEGGLKRGPKPDLFRDKCENGLHTQLTKREFQQFEQLRKQVGRQFTRSIFLRYVICEFLETHRRKDCPTMPFTLDLAAVDHRCRRGSREAVSAAPAVLTAAQ